MKASRKKREEAEGAQEPKRVLIVSHDEPHAQQARRIVAKLGHTGETVIGAENALARLKTARPDLLIIDKNVTMAGGLPFLIVVRANSDYAHLPILVLSEDGLDYG